MKRYKITGMVWGNCWGGGSCGYQAETLKSDSKTKILAEAKKLFESGGLDSGMGYESLTGAVLTLTTIETQIIDGREFVNREQEEVILGKLTDEQYECCLMNL